MKKTGTHNDKGEKWCSVCKKYQPMHEFGKNSNSNDGKDWRCIGSRAKRINIAKATEEVLIAVTHIGTPILASQVLYKYQRPDAYDIYMKDLHPKQITFYP